MRFTGDPTGFTDPQATGGATFSTLPLTRDVVVAGVPKLRLSALRSHITCARGTGSCCA
ncbi:MAG TPA: hypothetical protein VGR11_16715 [Solirubrobacteraceae bacterium]|nr:hypothetical protein [Solirubrobacteraceae bacterium]